MCLAFGLQYRARSAEDFATAALFRGLYRRDAVDSLIPWLGSASMYPHCSGFRCTARAEASIGRQLSRRESAHKTCFDLAIESTALVSSFGASSWNYQSWSCGVCSKTMRHKFLKLCLLESIGRFLAVEP